MTESKRCFRRRRAWQTRLQTYNANHAEMHRQPTPRRLPQEWEPFEIGWFASLTGSFGTKRTQKMRFRMLWSQPTRKPAVCERPTSGGPGFPGLSFNDVGCSGGGPNLAGATSNPTQWNRRVENPRTLRRYRPTEASPYGSLLMELPQRQHEVMVLRHLQGMPFEEIARVLDIAPATARVHARAGRETLRSLILKRDPDWFDRTGRPGGEL